MIDIGWRYYAGVGVRKNPTRAVQCFVRAIRSKPPAEITEAGREDAMFCLGVAYSEGQGVRRSLAMAQKWWKRAAAGGHWEAIARLKSG